MKKIVVLVLDGFGVGAMDDCIEVRPQDITSNTALHVLENVSLPNLEKLGLGNTLNILPKCLSKSKNAVFGTSKLAHFGGDTFFGHQEIMGTKPLKPLRLAFKNVINQVEESLIKNGFSPKRITRDSVSLLCIDDVIYIGDNLETDFGQVYNITTSFEYVSFKDVKTIAQIVRDVVKVARVIVFGGEEVTKEDLFNAIETKNDTYIGVNAPQSGVYNKGYLVEHLGYGVDASIQVQTKLYEEKEIKTAFLGKVADICDNKYGDSYSIVPTHTVMTNLISVINTNTYGFICANVQETDLAGHAEDKQKYIEVLKIVDSFLPKVIQSLSQEDLLIIMADHGNDPTIGHSKHTRENVPILIYKDGIHEINVGMRSTLADVGATVREFHNVSKPKFGKSFLGLLQ